MTLPLRIELAMTLKAVFPDILALRPFWTWEPKAIEAGFGLQHTDFADRRQRFTGLGSHAGIVRPRRADRRRTRQNQLDSGPAFGHRKAVKVQLRPQTTKWSR